jgi:hypothetical protein
MDQEIIIKTSAIAGIMGALLTFIVGLSPVGDMRSFILKGFEIASEDLLNNMIRFYGIIISVLFILFFIGLAYLGKTIKRKSLLTLSVIGFILHIITFLAYVFGGVLMPIGNIIRLFVFMPLLFLLGFSILKLKEYWKINYFTGLAYIFGAGSLILFWIADIISRPLFTSGGSFINPLIYSLVFPYIFIPLISLAIILNSIFLFKFKTIQENQVEEKI